jgi:hypothetical protein
MSFHRRQFEDRKNRRPKKSKPASQLAYSFFPDSRRVTHQHNAELAPFARVLATLLIRSLLTLPRLTLAGLIALTAFLRLLIGALASGLLPLPRSRGVLTTLAALLAALVPILVLLRLLTAALVLVSWLPAARWVHLALAFSVAIVWHTSVSSVGAVERAARTQLVGRRARRLSFYNDSARA